MGIPRTAARAPLLRAIAKNGNLGATVLCGAAIHRTIRRRAEHAGYDHAWPNSADTLYELVSSPKAPATALAVQPSPAKPDTPASTPVEVYRREHAPRVGNAVNEIGL
ncbi:hypothetical protein R3P93_06595 [Rhodococcus cerastii]|uniref:Uncharacterized protein n=1 Tax=Rhodococcus cerastii TaxID=908616 RepID=A0ABU4CXN9_9NOCA|nr:MULTISPECIES: hypothetical protein [Rhodococcus]MDV6302225.1 hypothetical protein [Rhodococcus cerastii]MDV8057886.1 hypothetical protein [Rhodococcus sp. IEGM 1343]